MPQQLLIAGLGNIFLGDDAFGVEVVAELQRIDLPDDVRVVDFGIRGLDLTYALLDGYRAVILVDAVRRGGHAGDLYVIEPGADAAAAQLPAAAPLIDMHEMTPDRVLRVVQSLGGALDRIVLVGCEPAAVEDYEEMQPGLSEAVRQAIPRAVQLIQGLITEFEDARRLDAAAGAIHHEETLPLPRAVHR